MQKTALRYMTYGRIVGYKGEEYKLLGDMGEAEAGQVKAVRMAEKRRYELLLAWSRNQSSGLKEEEQKEMGALVRLIPCKDCVPVEKVRFINSDYKTLFTVTAGDKVNINGRAYEVYPLDEGAYHISLVDENGDNACVTYGGCFHICQFAELAEKNGWDVSPVKEEST